MREHVISNLLEDFERGRITRRQLVQHLAWGALGLAVTGVSTVATGKSKGFKAVAVDHISYQVADYAKTRDFYSGLLGLKVSEDTGTQCSLFVNGSKTYILARNAQSGVIPPHIDHIAYAIAGWDTNVVKAELQRRGLNPTPTRNSSFKAYPSFYVKDPDGFDLQISSSIEDTQ